MAAFSPKDLMNPMKKMEASLEDIKNDSKEVLTVITGYTTGVGETLVSIKEDVSAIRKVLDTFLTKYTATRRLDKIKRIASKNKEDEGSETKKLTAKEGVELFKTLGIATKDFAIGMFMFKFVPKKSADNLDYILKSLITTLTDTDDKTLDKAKELGEIGKGLFQFSAYMLLAAPLALGATIAMPAIALEVWVFSHLFGSQSMQKRLTIATASLKQLNVGAASLFKFELAFVLAGMLAISAITAMPAVVASIWVFGMLLGSKYLSVKVQTANKTLQALEKTGRSLLIFEGFLALAGLASIVTFATLPFFTATMLTTIGLLWLLSATQKITEEGAKTLNKLAVTFILFSISMVIMGIAMKMMDYGAILKMGLVIVVLAGICAILGISQVATLVLAGAAVLEEVVDPLLTFAVGMLLLSVAAMMFTPEVAERMSSMMMTIGMSMAMVGIWSPFILLGSIAMLAAGLALVTVSIGVLLLGLALRALKEKDQDRIPSLIWDIGWAFAKVGFVSIFTLLGSAAMIVAGVALITVSIGFLLMGVALRVLKPDDDERIPNLITGTGKAFALVGLMFLPIMLGAVSMMLVAVSLLMLAPALALFKKIGWKQKDSDGLREAITSVRNGFLGIEKGDGVLIVLKKVAASIAGSAALMAIVPAYIMAGVALSSLARGLKKVKELDWDPVTDSEKLTTMLGTVTNAFATVAKDANAAGNMYKRSASIGGIFGKLLGGLTVERNAVEEGIHSVRGAGAALIDISTGLVDFMKWYKKYRNILEVKTGKSPFYEALENTLTSVGNAFAAIGNQNKVKDGWGPFTWEESSVEAGIEAVEGAGGTLKDIAEGLVKFTEWYNKYKDKLDIKNPKSEFFVALTTTLTSVGHAFAAIAGEEFTEQEEFGAFKWSNNKVEEGIEAVQGVQDVLVGMADGLIKFTDFYKQNKKDLDSTEVDEKGVPKNGLLRALYVTIGAIGRAFASLGGEENEYSSFLFFSNNAVEEGIEAVLKVDEALSKITEGVQTFVRARIKDEQIDTITKLITSLGTFGKLADVEIDEIGEDFNDFSKDFLKGLDRIFKKKENVSRMKNINVLMFTMERQVRLNTFNKAAAGIKKIADAVNSIDVEKGKSFSNLFVAASKLKDNSQFYEDLVQAIEDIRDLLAENGISNKSEGANASSGNNQPANRQQTYTPPPPAPTVTPKMPKEISVKELRISADSVYVNQ